MRNFYKTHEGICYMWIFSQSRTRYGVKEVAPQGHPFIIPIEEVECHHCNSCEEQ